MTEKDSYEDFAKDAAPAKWDGVEVVKDSGLTFGDHTKGQTIDYMKSNGKLDFHLLLI